MEIHNPTFFQSLINFYGYFLPLILLTWIAIAILDIEKRDDLRGKNGILWIMVLILFPWIGSLAYVYLGKSQISAPVKNGFFLGGAVILVFILVLSSFVPWYA